MSAEKVNNSNNNILWRDVLMSLDEKSCRWGTSIDNLCHIMLQNWALNQSLENLIISFFYFWSTIKNGSFLFVSIFCFEYCVQLKYQTAILRLGFPSVWVFFFNRNHTKWYWVYIGDSYIWKIYWIFMWHYPCQFCAQYFKFFWN